MTLFFNKVNKGRFVGVKFSTKGRKNKKNKVFKFDKS